MELERSNEVLVLLASLRFVEPNNDTVMELKVVSV